MLSLYFVYLDMGLDHVYLCVFVCLRRYIHTLLAATRSTRTYSIARAATLATIGAAAGAPSGSNGSGTTSSLASPVETAPRRARSGLGFATGGMDASAARRRLPRRLG